MDTNMPVDRKTLLKRNEFIYTASQVLHALIFTIPIGFLFLQQRFSPSEIAFAVAVGPIIQLLSELPTGALADLIGRGRVIAIGYFIGAISTIFIPFAWSFPLLVLTYVAFGLSESLLSGALEAMLYDTLKEQGRENDFRKVMGKNNAIYQIGLLIGTFAGGFMYIVAQWLPFIVYGLALLIAGAISLWFTEPDIDSETFTLRNYLAQIKEGIKEIVKSKHALYISLFYIIVGAITWSSTLYFSDMVVIEMGYTAIQIALFYSAVRFFNIAITRYLWTNDTLFTKERTYIFFTIVMIVCFLPGVFFAGIWAIPFISVIIALTSARFTLLAKYSNEMFSSKNRASAISSLSMAISILYFSFTLASSAIVPQLTNFRGIFTLFGALSVITLPLLTVLILRKPEHKGA
jgi:MFS family permease